MAIAYQYTSTGYFVGPIEDYGLLPNNATYVTPSEKAGYVPRWTGNAWVQVEDHKGLEGYLDGQAHTIKNYGPLPEGFSETAPEPVPPSPEEQQAMFTAAIQAHLDGFARTRNYDGILSATTYATSSVPKFRAEGQYAVEARDATWATAYEILDAVLSGARPIPASIDDVLADLPQLVWPEV